MRRRLIAMSRDGQIASNRAGDFGVLDKMSLVRGRVIGHRDGFGFVVPRDGGDDLFLSHRQMKKVFDGDEVLVRETPAASAASARVRWCVSSSTTLNSWPGA
ncbi:hypothetical protein [Microbulbifer taiwanensis]|uniref:hypothetical protein n=1 Tax=Microbulbifer taiwanensis TaxID=986746 RepID=UPI003621E47B